MENHRLELLTAMLFATCVPIAHVQTVDHESGEHGASSSHENTHGSHKSILSFIAGVTHAGRRENGPAFGVGYERLLSKSFSLGVLAEHTFGDVDV